MKTAAAICGIFAVCTPALAQPSDLVQRSQFSLELSTDGVNWTRNLALDPALGQPVFARVLIDYYENGGPTPIGLASGKSQPLVRGWSPAAGDTLLGYDQSNRIIPDYSLTDGDGYAMGRTRGPSSTYAIVPHVYTFQNEGYLRFASSLAYFHPGQGFGRNNVTGLEGIVHAADTFSYITATRGLELFVWGMTFAPSRTGSVHLDIPRESFRTPSGETFRSTQWAVRPTPSTFEFVESPMLDTLGANLTFIPTPGALAPFGAVCALTFRRRRA